MGFPPFNPLWLPPSGIVTPMIDGLAIYNSGNHVSSEQLSGLTTIHPNELIVFAMVMNNRGAASGNTVATLTSPNLTFTQRNAVGWNAIGGASVWETLNYWTAPAVSTLSSEVITATNALGNVVAAAGFAFGISGLSNINSPFDPNVSLPRNATQSGTTFNTSPSISGLSTSNTGTTMWLFFDSSIEDTTDPGSAPSGFTQAAKIHAGLTDSQCNIYAYYQLVQGAQSNQTITDGSVWPGGNAGWAAIADALVVS